MLLNTKLFKYAIYQLFNFGHECVYTYGAQLICIKYVTFEMQLRVSSIISNGKIILTVDCDMYSNNSESIRDALCFFMDEEKGHEIAYVQFPQNFENVTKNDLYSSALLLVSEVSIFFIFISKVT